MNLEGIGMNRKKRRNVWLCAKPAFLRDYIRAGELPKETKKRRRFGHGPLNMNTDLFYVILN